MAERSATPEQMNKFVRSVDEFFQKFARLDTPQMRSDVYSSRNSQLIADYEQTIDQGRILKATIENTVGAWNAAKAAWSAVTDTTSMAIGDAIDRVRSWFGYEPAPGVSAYHASPISSGGLGLLSAIQLPAAAWVTGIIAATYLLNGAMDKIFISVEASRIQRADPTISRERALVQATDAVKSLNIFGRATLPLLAAAALAAYLLLRKR